MSYVVDSKSKGKKNVLVLSTQPPLLGVTKDDGKSKPAIIKFYDFTKGGTDIADQRTAGNTTSTKTRRWTRKVTAYILDVARVNAQTIFCLNKKLDPRKYDSGTFAKALGMAMIKPHLQIRRGKQGIQQRVIQSIDMFFHQAGQIVKSKENM